MRASASQENLSRIMWYICVCVCVRVRVCRVVQSGFTLSSIERSTHAAAVGRLTAASMVDKDTEISIKAHLAARSAKYSTLQKVRPLQNYHSQTACK